MKELHVNAGGGYHIKIENNILNKSGVLLRAVSGAKKACIVSDSHVFPLYGDTVKAQLQENGFEVCEFVFPAGEGSKTTDTLIGIVEHLAENELTRGDLVVALGGGVVGDMAGFAAAIYLRGIDFVQMPTSLLAQVDSSVGGKTAVDLPQGKNLCGAFHQPILVLIDPHTLRTLPAHYFSDGMAEAIKMGCIQSRALFERIENDRDGAAIEDIIFECVRLKAAVVARDEKEHGERALLNFGHTAGHAIEKLHGFEGITHGEAVGIGMVMLCRAAEAAGLTEIGCSERIAQLLKKYHLRTEDSHSTAAIVEAMRADKKRTESGINFIIIKQIGEGAIYPIKNEDIPAFFGV